jgi:hypothetical protein
MYFWYYTASCSAWRMKKGGCSIVLLYDLAHLACIASRSRACVWYDKLQAHWYNVPIIYFFFLHKERGLEDPRRTSIPTHGRLQTCRRALLQHSHWRTRN